MTNREFYKAVISNTINPEMVEYAKAELEKLDKRNENRRNTKSKEQIANENIKTEILQFVTGRPKAVASEIAVALTLSTQKVSALCHQLVTEGKMSVETVKVKGKSPVKGYTVINEE